ncbi:MAG: hypothetical protein JWM58_670 [Rhizobium sp.]|nr:hypothetical protein [Rhizobium sp.]
MQAKLLAGFLALAAFPALAQTNEPVRYQLISVSGGFVRLDAVTGTMTFCRDEVDSFRCTPIAGDPAKVDMQPGAGATSKDAAKDPVKGEIDRKEDSSLEDFDQALTIMEKAMKRFMAMSNESPRDCAL